MATKRKRLWEPSRQVVRGRIRAELWDRLKGTDFEGDPVRISDSMGRPVIHGPNRKTLRSMLKQGATKRFRDLRAERADAH